MGLPSSIYINNDHIIRVEGLKDSNGNVIEGADITISVFSYTNDELIFQTTMIPSQDVIGDYEGILEDDIQLKLNVTYRLQIEASKNSLKGTWSKPIKAIYREF